MILPLLATVHVAEAHLSAAMAYLGSVQPTQAITEIPDWMKWLRILFENFLG